MTSYYKISQRKKNGGIVLFFIALIYQLSEYRMDHKIMGVLGMDLLEFKIDIGECYGQDDYVLPRNVSVPKAISPIDVRKSFNKPCQYTLRMTKKTSNCFYLVLTANVGPNTLNFK